jgi:methylated-DNA-protein-cysteine methyltransferase-like protein
MFTTVKTKRSSHLRKKQPLKPATGSNDASPGRHGASSKPTKSEKIQSAIRAAIRSIPSGKVSTYGSVARAAGCANGARQAAATLHHSVGLPWHRVLGAGGEIKLRGDSAFEQRFRLQAEGVTFRGRHVDMARHEFKFPRRKTARSAKPAKVRKS